MIAYDGNATVKVLKGPNAGECLVLSGNDSIIGRESHCNLVLPLATVSRQHARIVHDAQGFFLQDLGSLNGTFVNSTRVIDSQRLKGGDHIQIDEVLLSFRQGGQADGDTDDTAEHSVRIEPAPDGPSARTTAYNVVNIWTGDGLRAQADPARKLDAVCELMRSVGTSLEVNEVLPNILDSLFEVFPQADRGHIFLTEETSGKLDSRAFKVRNCDGPPPSTLGPGNAQIAATAVATGQPALYSSGVPQPGSVLDDRVRALACVPLITPLNRTIGALQLETEDAGRQFVAEDLELLTTVGSLAGQLVEHARLHERRSHEEARAREHAAVEQERRLLQTVLDVLPVGVFIADSKGRILQANAEAAIIWGGPINLSRDPSQYPRDFPAWSLGRRLRWQEYGLARALAGDTANHGEELQIETLDRRQRTVLSYALPIQNTQQQIAGGVWVVVDITDRKRAERIVRVANERKDKFLAVLAHELRNPLALIRSALALLGEAESDADTANWARGLMEQQMEHMVRLVDDLLDVSRIAQGKIELRKETVELHRLVVQAVEMARPVIDAQRHLLHLALPEELIWIEADPVRMVQVFSNLLNNAVKYMQPEGSIHLSIRRDGNFAEVRIRDSGIGLAAEELPYVFDPFSQGDRARQRSQEGLGIGLSLVRGIVRMHGGEVTAHSDGPDRGSEFGVRLPVTIAPPQAAANAPPPEAARRRRLLVVDDQVGQAQILARVLTRFWQHDVQLAHDGPQAIAAAREHHPEIILLDIDLPGMNGFEVARELRSDPAFADTLIVALTGYGQDQYRRRAQEAGFDAHLVKPASLTDLEQLFAHPKLRHD